MKSQHQQIIVLISFIALIITLIGLAAGLTIQSDYLLDYLLDFFHLNQDSPGLFAQLVPSLLLVGISYGLLSGILLIAATIKDRRQSKIKVKKDSRGLPVRFDMSREDYYRARARKFYFLSIAHPKFLSKRFESVFLLQWYFQELNLAVIERIKAVIGESYLAESYPTRLKIGDVVKVKLYSPDIGFPEPVIKQLDAELCQITFLAKPLETCQPGKHSVSLTIQDNRTGLEYESLIFSVNVVDYSFDHVSRPLLSSASAVFLGIGSFAMFILTLFEQIDKTVGLTSGTAAGILAAVVYANFYNLFQRIRPNMP